MQRKKSISAYLRQDELPVQAYLRRYAFCCFGMRSLVSGTLLPGEPEKCHITQKRQVRRCFGSFRGGLIIVSTNDYYTIHFHNCNAELAILKQRSIRKYTLSSKKSSDNSTIKAPSVCTAIPPKNTEGSFSVICDVFSCKVNR